MHNCGMQLLNSSALCGDLNLQEERRSRWKLFERADVVDEGLLFFFFFLNVNVYFFKCADVRYRWHDFFLSALSLCLNSEKLIIEFV